MDLIKLKEELLDMAFYAALGGAFMLVGCVIVAFLLVGGVVYNIQHGWPIKDAVRRALKEWS